MSNVSLIYTKTSNINFLAVHTGGNITKKNIETELVHSIKTYESRVFKITAVHGDNEFDLDDV